MNNSLVLYLEGPIVPKARPRVTRTGTYMPPAYADWKEAAITSFGMRQKEMAISSPVSINIYLLGKHSRAGDLDNVSGSILDALVQANILAKDNMMVVQSLTICLEYNKKAEPRCKIVIS
jgi:Holliday junction resolvase RusA-like endonuclease